jgi:hypothetical protein
MSTVPSDIWTGHWKWNAATASYTDPLHAGGAIHEQTMEVTARGFDHLSIRTNQRYADGSTRSWIYNGAFDGRPYPIRWADNDELMTTISFGPVGPLTGTDGFISAGAHPFTGAEYFLLGEQRVESRGFIAIDGEHYPYWEEWHRVQ